MAEQLKIDPQNVVLDFAGQRTRKWFVRLPTGMTADDLKDPAIWSKVQNNRNTAVARHDEVYCVGFAEDFAVHARVTATNATSATLGKISIISFPERAVPLFSDETYRIAWVGDGFAVIRRSDERKMGPTFGSEELAILHLKRQYPAHA